MDGLLDHIIDWLIDARTAGIKAVQNLPDVLAQCTSSLRRPPSRS